MLKSIKKHLKKLRRRRYDYEGDVFGVRSVNTSFLNDETFEKAWKVAKTRNSELWLAGVPDIRWRSHVCLWAARQGLNLEGDFVECGVYGGLLSITICEYFDFRNTSPRFWLFDTFNGLPMAQLPPEELQVALKKNKRYKFDCFALAQRNFAPYPNVTLVKGALPSSLSDALELKRISYLSMDLNSASAERETIYALWSIIAPGAVIVLDDYGFSSLSQQYEMWNQFAQSKNRSVLTLPTGQGLLIK